MRISKCVIDDKGRECTTCGKYQSWSNYHKSTVGVNGHSARCKPCYNFLTKNYYTNNKDHVRKLMIDASLKRNKPGVYQVHTNKGRYIGQSKQMYKRVHSGHKTKNQLNAVNAVNAKVLSWEVLEYIEDRQLRLQRERYWIDKLKPELNTNLVYPDR